MERDGAKKALQRKTSDCEGCMEDAILGGEGWCFEHRVLIQSARDYLADRKRRA